MITAIREVRRARGLTLEEVARACDPPTTAQTIGRLETGTRTVSVGWLNRIAAALGVPAADLVTLPDRGTLPVAALLDPGGARAPRRPASVIPPSPAAGMVSVPVTGSVGDYRAGDELWMEPLAPDAFAHAINRDILVPLPAGALAFGRLLALDGEALSVLPPRPGAGPAAIASPAWIARAVKLVRTL